MPIVPLTQLKSEQGTPQTIGKNFIKISVHDFSRGDKIILQI